jgi:flagellar motor switch protein FliM
MRVLQRVHELFARDVSVYLSSQLRTMVEITLTAVGQVTYSEYVASSAWPSALYVGEAVGMNDRLIFEIDPSFVVYTVEKLFGGPGQFLETPREVSKIEQRIMSRVVRKAFSELEAAWQQAHEIQIREVAFESNAEFIQILPSMEPGIVAAFEMSVQGRLVPLNLFYPYSLLDKMIGGAGMQRWAAGATTEVPAPVRSRYEDALRSMDVEIRAELGRTRLSLGDIAALQEGDVIPLQRWTDEPVRVTIGDKETLTAAAGTAGKQYALRVLSVSAASDFPLTP